MNDSQLKPSQGWRDWLNLKPGGGLVLAPRSWGSCGGVAAWNAQVLGALVVVLAMAAFVCTSDHV